MTSPSQVLRLSLRDEICRGSPSKLVLVRAPAGFGKTTVMSQCRAQLEDKGVDTAWLTLDPADNDPSRFVTCLAAALASIVVGRTRRASPVSPAGHAAKSAGIEAIDRLAAHAFEIVFFIDDVEVIHDAAVLSLLAEIIERLPQKGRLVLGSRGLPDLGLGRLRARGQLLEIETDRLRFSFEETSEFLQLRRQLPLLAPDLLRLHEKTDGWVTAIWLASLSLERRDGHGEFIRRFSGSNKAVAEYLVDDVLSQQPPRVRRFLLQTSILRHLHAPLCDALVTDGGSAGILEMLVAANLFIAPIDSDDGIRGYRYHALFASFLRGELEREQPQAASALHRRASRWYESQGRPVPAIDHAIEAGSIDHALSLMSQHAEDLLAQGRLRLLTRWFAAIPESALADRPGLQVVRAWALCFTHGPWDAMALIERLDVKTTADAQTATRLLALRPALFAMMDRYEEASIAGTDGLKHLPQENSFAYAVLSNAMAHIHFVHGRYPEARRQLDLARQAQGRHASRFNVMYSESVEGLIDLQEGRMRQAAARFRMAVHATPHENTSGAGGNAWAGVLHALAVYESGDLVHAERLLHVYVPLARDVGLPDHMILGYAMLARMAFSRGDIDRAFQWLIELEYLGHQRQLPRVAASAQLERARILLMQGHAPAAAEELKRAQASGIWERLAPFRLPTDSEDYAVGRLRWEALAGDARAAAAALQAEIDRARLASSHRRALKLRFLLAVARQRSEAERAAMTGLREALQAACQEGVVRLVVDEGPALGVMVRALADRETQRSALRDPLFADYLLRLCEGFGIDASIPAFAVEPSLPLDPLTPGELRVLGLLAEGDSNAAMARKLFVSDSTVRTHLRNINGKLDVTSRTQAIAVARKLGLVH